MTEEDLQQIRERAEMQPLIVFEHISMEERPRVRAAFSDRWALIHEVERLQLVADAAMDEIAFQRDMNQQIGKENERLQAQNAAMREIVPLMTHSKWYEAETEYGEKIICRGCGVELYPLKSEHRAECPVITARAILATDSA